VEHAHRGIIKSDLNTNRCLWQSIWGEHRDVSVHPLTHLCLG